MSSAVNRPTNVKVKDQDINQKLQLFGIYEGFSRGKAPSNKQIDVAMNSALASRPLANPSNKLSAEGQTLVADVRDVIEKAKVLLLTKNEGNLIQDFIWQAQSITTGNAQTPNMPVNKDGAKQDGKEAVEGLRTLGTLLISNGQFRKLLNDFVILARDIAGDGASRAATSVKPSDDQLSQIDKPADDNTWHDVPDFKNMKGQMKEQYEKNMPFKKEDVQAARSGEGSTTDALREKASANMPEESKDKGREMRDKAKNYYDEKMPKERREQTIWRMKKMIVEIQGHQDYQRAIDTLLRLAETYAGHSKSVGTDSAGTVKEMFDTSRPMLTDIKILIERFANSTSMDDLIDSINVIYKDAEQDPELKGWFKRIDSYIRRCLKEQGFVMQDAANQEFNQLYDQGKFLLRERYRNHSNRVIDEVKFLADQFDSDPQNKAFANSMNKLFNDLGTDKDGKPQFKPHLLKDVGNVILPGFFENVRYIPIPRIEYSDPMADAVIENLVIEGDNLAPNIFEFGSDNYFRWGRKQVANKNKNSVMLSVSGIQMDLRDVSYYVKKKQGFPSITDKGLMDIFLGGTGVSFKVAMETADAADKAHFFQVKNVTVDIKHMNIKLKQSKYKLLFSVVKPLMFRLMNPILNKVLQKVIRDQVTNLDGYLYAIHRDAKKAQNEIQRDPAQTTNIYKEWVNAWKARLEADKKQKEEEAKKKTDDKKLNIALTQHDSIFKDITLPGGVSTKATEYRELAMKGEKWESPVFSIGSAKETGSLPRITPVSRKPHNVTASELKPSGTDTTSASNTQVNGTTFGSTTYSNSTMKETSNTTFGSANPVLQGSV